MVWAVAVSVAVSGGAGCHGSCAPVVAILGTVGVRAAVVIAREVGEPDREWSERPDHSANARHSAALK